MFCILTIQAEALCVTREAGACGGCRREGTDDVLLVPLADVEVRTVVAREAGEEGMESGEGELVEFGRGGEWDEAVAGVDGGEDGAAVDEGRSSFPGRGGCGGVRPESLSQRVLTCDQMLAGSRVESQWTVCGGAVVWSKRVPGAANWLPLIPSMK